MSAKRKKIGFLSFGHWSPSPHSQTRTACSRNARPKQRAGA
jgi:hypothetical protein